jgi:Tfp pilus assembly protein PilX
MPNVPELNLTNFLVPILILILASLPIVLFIFLVSVIRSLRRIAVAHERIAHCVDWNSEVEESRAHAALQPGERNIVNSIFGR